MDKEAQKKIENILLEFLVASLGIGAIPKEVAKIRARDIITKLKELGYHKLPGDKPPLLTNKEVADWLYGKPLDKDYEQLKLEAQREADIKHYED